MGGVRKFMAYSYLPGRDVSGKWAASHLTAGTENIVKLWI